MPTIGDKEFPATNIDTAVDSAKKIAVQFKGQPFDRTALATALKYKSASTGGFNQMLADLRKYGLVSGRGEMLQATDLVQKLAVPQHDQEYSDAVVEAMNNVPLFRELYDHYQGSVPAEDDLLTTLINTTKGERITVQGIVPRIRGILASGWAKGGPYRTPAKGSGPGTTLTRVTGEPEPAGDVITLTAGKLHLRYPLTEDGIELMKVNFEGDRFWKILLKQVKPVAEPSGEKSAVS